MQYINRFAIVLIASVAGSGKLASPQSDIEDTLEQRVGEIVAQAMRANDIGGLSIAVSIGSEVLLEDGWGVAMDGSPAGAHSPYGVGPLLEQWIRVAMLTLVEQEAFTLDEPLATFFPVLEEHAGLRLEHLMAHTSGLPYDAIDLAGRMRRDEQSVRDSLLGGLSEIPLESTPGECFAFSPTNTLLLGWILEDTTSNPLPTILERRIFDPANMDCTEFDSSNVPFQSLQQAAQEVTGKLEWDHSGAQLFRAAEVKACAADVLAWQRALLDRELLDDDQTRKMLAPTVLSDGSEVPHGFGLNISTLGEQRCLGHGGVIGDFRLHVAYYPAFDISLALLATGESAPLEGTARRIVRAVFDLPEPGVHTRPLPDAERQKYTGSYNIGCTRLIITSEDDHLALEAVDYPRFELHYQGRHRFIAESNPEINVTFQVQDGAVVSFTLDEYGTRSRAVRLE